MEISVDIGKMCFLVFICRVTVIQSLCITYKNGLMNKIKFSYSWVTKSNERKRHLEHIFQSQNKLGIRYKYV